MSRRNCRPATCRPAGPLRLVTLEARVVPSAVPVRPPGSDGFSSVSDVSTFDDRLYFNAAVPGEAAIGFWTSDGTAAGTAKLAEIKAGFGGFSRVELGGRLYFTAEDTAHGLELWRTDGTPAGTELVQDINPGPDGSAVSGLVRLGNDLYFAAAVGGSGRQLWKSDGTPGGTTLVHAIPNGGVSGSPVVSNNTLFFRASDGPAASQRGQLWKSDGTAAGTAIVKRLTPGTPVGPMVGGLTDLDGTLFFNAHSLEGLELWKSDGTEAGTVLVKDINPEGSSLSSTYTPPVAFKGMVFFQAFSPGGGSELWKSDGTEAGTVPVAAGRVKGGQYLTEVGGELFFNGHRADTGNELFKTDGTVEGTVLVKDLRAGPGSSDSYHFAAAGGLLYLSAYTGGGNHSLWKSDGTRAGTRQVVPAGGSDTAVNPGGPTAHPQQIMELEGQIFFTAGDGIYPRQLWKVAPREFTDSDGDAVTVRLTGPGYVDIVLDDPDGDGRGPIARLDLLDTDPNKTKLTVKVRAGDDGDGRVAIGSVAGSGLKSLNLAKSTLDGQGIHIDEPIGTLTLDAVAAGDIVAPSIGKLLVRGDFSGSVSISGEGVEEGKPALKVMTVAGAVVGGRIAVEGDVGSVAVGSFVDSHLFAGYAGAIDGTGDFSPTPRTIGSFRTTAKLGTFADSSVVADTVGRVALVDVTPDNGDAEFGVFADTSIGVVRVRSLGEVFRDPVDPVERDDFRVRLA